MDEDQLNQTKSFVHTCETSRVELSIEFYTQIYNTRANRFKTIIPNVTKTNIEEICEKARRLINDPSNMHRAKGQVWYIMRFGKYTTRGVLLLKYENNGNLADIPLELVGKNLVEKLLAFWRKCEKISLDDEVASELEKQEREREANG